MQAKCSTLRRDYPHVSCGESRKRDALDTLEARREDLIVRARRAFLKALLCRGESTIDPVRELVPVPPETSPKLFGAVPGRLARAGLIERASYRPTTRAEAHARPVSLWRLKDRPGAMRWLEQHPEPAPEAETGGDCAGQMMLYDDGPAGEGA